MAITRKPGPAQNVALIGQVPQPPRIPQEVIDRFQSMQGYQDEMDRWWNRFGDMLQRDLDQITTKFKADEATTQTLTARIAALEARLTKAGI